jgi:uncharacterized damage-inducible protein DinB
MLHLAMVDAGMASIGIGVPFAFTLFTSQNIEKLPALQNKDSVVYYVNTSYDVMINGIKNLDVDKFTEVVSFTLPGGKRTATRLGWIMKAFEHQTHHLAQCTVYFRLLDLRPPPDKMY